MRVSLLPTLRTTAPVGDHPNTATVSQSVLVSGFNHASRRGFRFGVAGPLALATPGQRRATGDLSLRPSILSPLANRDTAGLYLNSNESGSEPLSPVRGGGSVFQWQLGDATFALDSRSGIPEDGGSDHGVMEKPDETTSSDSEWNSGLSALSRVLMAGSPPPAPGVKLAAMAARLSRLQLHPEPATNSVLDSPTADLGREAAGDVISAQTGSGSGSDVINVSLSDSDSGSFHGSVITVTSKSSLLGGGDSGSGSGSESGSLASGGMLTGANDHHADEWEMPDSFSDAPMSMLWSW